MAASIIPSAMKSISQLSGLLNDDRFKTIIKSLGNVQETIQFEGFNIQAFFLHVMSKAGSDVNKFYEDLFFAVAIGIVRGNLRGDVLGKMENKANQAKIQGVINALDIQLRSTKTDHIPLKSTTITFTRLVATFPSIGYQLLSSPLDQGGIKGREILNDLYGVNELPNQMRFTGFVALLGLRDWPNDTVYHLAMACYGFCILFDMEINNKSEPDGRRMQSFFAMTMRYDVKLPLDFFGPEIRALGDYAHPKIVEVSKKVQVGLGHKVPAFLSDMRKLAREHTEKNPGRKEGQPRLA